eukprot:CAMPEP_0117605024 /NCGR_PEP_ID=MMETSP0784-20121206/78984_1 /TAXON_ID=39447 /ORGANISM="" /LENGTH=308 /DNA_ID=CAMNT_0005408063 /DNA_START=18 /DNA_END=943 /DNA_ORIENTATION=-
MSAPSAPVAPSAEQAVQDPPQYSASIVSRFIRGGITYYSVLVTCGAQSWTVERRYTDFEKLSLDLQSAGQVYLPAMPRKSTFRKTFSISFCDDRQRQLGNLLHAAICADPYLQKFLALKLFVGLISTSTVTTAGASAGPIAQIYPQAYAQPAPPPPPPVYGQTTPAYVQHAPAYAAAWASVFAACEGATAASLRAPSASICAGATRGSRVGAGVAGVAAGVVGGMLLESALEGPRHEVYRAPFGFGGGPGFLGTEEVIRDVRTDMFGDTEVRTEVIDRNMFGQVTEVREEIVERDMFGGVTEVFTDAW